jgi:tetratricopeptide (TPR) repeat protein
MKRITISILAAAILFAAPVRSSDLIDTRAIVYYLQGAFFEARFDLQAALEFYERANRFEQNNPMIHISLARIYLELGDLGRAKKYAADLQESDRYGYEASLILAEIAYKEDDKNGALALLVPLIEIDNDSRFDVLKFLSKVYLDLGRIDEARDVLEDAVRLFSEDLYLQYKLGILYYETGRMEEAVQAFRKAIEINPGFTNAHFALATLLLQIGRYEEAETSYRNVLKLDPRNGTALKELADLLFEREEFEEGIELIEPLREEDLLDDGGRLALGRFYYRAGRIDDALSMFGELVDEQGENVAIMRIIAEIEIQRGHFKTACRYLRMAIETERDNFGNYIGILLIVHGLAGEPDGPEESVEIPPGEAAGYLDEAVRTLNADSAEDNYLIGAVMRKAGKPERAERFLLRAEQLAPDDRRTLLELATLYERRGEFDEALGRISRLYEKDSEDASVNNYYGYLLAEKGERLDFAEQLVRKALLSEPENGYFLDSLGWILFKKGNAEGALKVLIDATGYAGEDPVIWDHLGQTYERLGEGAKAAESYRRSLSIDEENTRVRERLEMIEGSAGPEK